MSSANWQEPDGLLTTLVSMANKGAASFHITVLCNGAVIAGTIAGGNEYLEELGIAISKGIERSSPHIPREELVALSTYFRDLAEKIYPNDGDGERLENTFIHLKDVELITPEGWSLQSEFPYWRVTLASISGWTLGRPRFD